MEIFKFQKSLYTSDKSQRVMVYNETRSIQFEEEVTKADESEIAKLFNGSDKAYWHCDKGKDGAIIPIKPAYDLNEKPTW